ncbi:hypothetical protein ARGLB_037_00990 [Arthrobacter globiformis NBRC 12137]|uniref:Uncharacterized protein n=1 Tax=Arthrobacter globiformis (strain ATCC 8010 / DSM 20124 / JCM 1332 / NBRC 12137 / NCIMB 8907 / NRRL B-2979 / 168) TaxID=1077972 RepID=H0QK08_ARTG1|nr:hypothetical protein ARGLB_037_00990 [Arthrobacter globiformis NBRC 12137]
MGTRGFRIPAHRFGWPTARPRRARPSALRVPGYKRIDRRTALEAELAEHLGLEHGQTPIAANMRNGTRPKTVLTEIGPRDWRARDRDGSFGP